MRLTADQYIRMIILAREWSLASDGCDLVLYVRMTDDGPILRYFGPNSFGYPRDEMITFVQRVKAQVEYARSKQREYSNDRTQAT